MLKQTLNIILPAIALLLLSSSAYAFDAVKLYSPSWGTKSTAYKHDVLKRALEITRAEYGAYSTHITDIDIKPKRLIALMQTNAMVNVAVFAAEESWDNSATPIRIPIRGGALSYRLLLVNKSKLKQFEGVSTLSELKALTPGLVNDWSTTTVMEESDFQVVKSQHFEGLFAMLESGRIDYIPRAVYEAYDELEHRTADFPSIVIEPTIALLIPMVTYVYVAPSEPRIAERLSRGLHKLHETGELKRIFDRYYAEEFEKAKLSHRKVIKIDSEYFDNQQHVEIGNSENGLFWNLHNSNQ
ncbi:transporter substrate-binding domain-containing protein [Neiella marina]|uniref:Transporter substrate-binding domain-containing protein n=1 Tax=Neiella holothuriorum TaxID=2870530 RepID=A0ABS7EFT9_9GAMM|nr:transporter substrate-binding domain-containing protein [Neiella holothuriorum]MBW8190552.1 transporter substrate-binding domain-containing protein [Neiella holothuriorum]